MKQDRTVSVPPGKRRGSKTRARIQRIAATSATMIVALQSTAFARSDSTAQPEATDIFAVPILGPGVAAAAGALIATLGAYRLRKAQRRRGRAED